MSPDVGRGRAAGFVYSRFPELNHANLKNPIHRKSFLSELEISRLANSSAQALALDISVEAKRRNSIPSPHSPVYADILAEGKSRYNRICGHISVLKGRFRMKRVRTEYVSLRRAAICVQRGYRRLVVRRIVAKYDQEQHTTLRLIQKRFRGHLARVRYFRTRRSVAVIQSWYRMSRARKRYLLVKYAVTILKAFWLRHKAVKSFSGLRERVVKIQAIIRGVRTYML